MARDALVSAPAIVADPAEFDRLDSRVAFGRALGKIAENDPQVMAVVSDYGRRLALDALRSKLPGSVVQCGIAEQNQVEVASALANEGFHVFAPSYAPFITARVLDQVRVNLGMMESPAVLVGLGAGYHAGILGPSHMALEDLACARFRALPWWRRQQTPSLPAHSRSSRKIRGRPTSASRRRLLVTQRYPAEISSLGAVACLWMTRSVARQTLRLPPAAPSRRARWPPPSCCAGGGFPAVWWPLVP